MGKRDLVQYLTVRWHDYRILCFSIAPAQTMRSGCLALSSWCLVIVVSFFLAVPRLSAVCDCGISPLIFYGINMYGKSIIVQALS